MPLLIDEYKQLKEEMNLAKKGQLPPFMAFIITGGAVILSFIISALFVFPALRLYAGFNGIVSFFITIGAFIFLSIIVSELVTVILVRRPKK